MRNYWSKQLKSPAISSNELTIFWINCAKNVIYTLRKARFYPDKMKKSKKTDQSIVTQFDKKVENDVKKIVRKAFPFAKLIWEETWWNFSNKWLLFAIDPIDGTNSFVTHDKTNALSIAIFEDWVIRMWIVANPSTWEIFYATDKGKTKLIQMWFWQEEDLIRSLPSNKNDEESVMVDIQYSAKSWTKQKLDQAKKNMDIEYSKSSKWSPALNIAEASKWFYTYVCDWYAKPSTPYDLSAWFKIIKNAGWYMIDLDTQEEINPIWFNWTFVAWIHKSKVKKILNILENADK